MPKLPDIADLGPTPTADATRPVGSYDVSGFSRGAAALAQGGQQLGAGVEKFSEGVGELSLDQSRWDYAKAHSFLQTSLVAQNAATAQDTNNGTDDSGQTLTERHAAAVDDLHSQAADMIRDPRMRERFTTDTAPIVEESNVRAQAHAHALDNSSSLAWGDQQGRTTTDQYINATDDQTRTALIDSHNDLVDGLVAKGAYTPLEGFQAKQAWAHQTATADALHRADTDPQGVINELRSAPGSNDAVTNRILQIEGPGKAKTSSAVAGMTDGTWLSLIKQNRPDLADGQSDQNILALRADKSLLRDMTEANRASNETYLKAKGLDATPGAQYLAHFLGPAGAAAVLQADPKSSVADALTKAVGPDKAKQMIDANPSVLNGQLSGSVKQWADNKMGGAVPGGGSIYDMLRPDVREEVLAHAEAAQQKLQVGERADFQMKVANATAEALDTGQTSQPLSRSDFIAEYGAERGPVEFAKYDTQVQTGRTIAGMATMTQQERSATVASLAPQPGDPNYALKSHAFEVAQKAQQQLELQASKDPAGFAASSLPASKDAYQALGTALRNPQASPDDRAGAAQAFAGRTLMEQNRFGIPEDAQRVAPESYVDGLNKTISAAANSDDAGKRVGLVGQIQQEAAMWGSYWPQVMRQLAPGSQPIVRAIAAGADITAMTRLLSLDPKLEKPAELLKQQSETKAGDLTKAVDTSMAPFLGTLVGRQRDRDYTGYYNLATQLGALYVRDGMSASDAAGKAFNDLVGKNYDFRDSYRIPKTSGVSPDDVQAGAEAARVQIGAGGAPQGNLLEQARAQYPILKGYDYGYVENIKPGAGFLEHWEPGEPGEAPSADRPLDGLRPQALSIDKPGLEIRDRNTRPIDVLGDVVSHNLVNTDPVVKSAYEKLQGSMTPAQQNILKDQYAYAQKNEGETRSFDDWKTAAGMPGFFRGYTFQQWPKEFTDKAYTPEQRADLDKLMGYLSRGGSGGSPFNIKPAVDDIGLGANNTQDSLTKFGRDGKWVTAPDQSGLNLAYGDKFVRTNDGAPLKLSWDQLGKLGAGRKANIARENDLAPQL